MCARTPRSRHLDARRAVAAALDLALRRLAEDREVAGEQVRAVASQAAEAVERAVDLLVVVEDPGQIDGRLGEIEGEREGTATPPFMSTVPRPTRKPSSSRTGRFAFTGTVSMWPAIDHALGASQPGAGDDRVAVAGRPRGGRRWPGSPDRVGDRRLVAGDRLDVAQLARELDGAGARIEHGQGRIGQRHPNSFKAGGMTTRAAWGYGLATISANGTVLDTWFPSPHLGALPVGHRPLDRARRSSRPSRGPTSAATSTCSSARSRSTWRPHPRRPRTPTCACTCSEPPARRAQHDQPRRHLRPPARSWCGRTPGPCIPPTSTGCGRACSAAGIAAHGLDKFPRLHRLRHPERVRIADASRVRLGAHLAPGTTVMHEGFVNFNAGTLGASMVEGRISQGVVVGDGADIGGGASIMGTLSGGGTERVTIGAARAARRQLGHRHLDRRRLRRGGRPLRDRRHQGHGARRPASPASCKAAELCGVPGPALPPQLADGRRRGDLAHRHRA